MDVPLGRHPRSTAGGRVSVQRYETAEGVRWREDGGRMRSRTLATRREALAFDADVRTRRFRGEALPQPGRETLAAAYEEWWRLRGSTLAATDSDSWRRWVDVQSRFHQYSFGYVASWAGGGEAAIAAIRASGQRDPAGGYAHPRRRRGRAGGGGMTATSLATVPERAVQLILVLPGVEPGRGRRSRRLPRPYWEQADACDLGGRLTARSETARIVIEAEPLDDGTWRGH